MGDKDNVKRLADHKPEQDELPGILPVDEHVEEVSENGRPVRRKGIYLLPNLLTTGALFCGFFSIVAAMNGKFESGAVAIFIAMLLDGLDGRVARLTNTQSAFGAEYDSLSDMVSFGIAPSLLVFGWSLAPLGKIGWAAAFIYVAGAALRLARFNTQAEIADKRYFTGLPSPAAAAVAAAVVWAWQDVATTTGMQEAAFSAIVLATLGMLMVSNIRYHSFKGIDFRGRVPFVAMLAIIMVFVIVTIDPPKVLLVTFMIYAVSGPVARLFTFWKR